MFSGIITTNKPITDIRDHDGMRECSIAVPAGWNIQVGESISVDGVCSTVASVAEQDFTVAYMPETLRLTTLNGVAKNGMVNLERSMKLSDLLSGHLVSGHIDCTGIVSEITPEGDSHRLTISYPSTFAPYLIQKGSVAVNGVSLTVIDPVDTIFSVAIIPHTWTHTTMHLLHVGDAVNLEFDMIAKYISKQLSHVNT